MLDKNIQFIKGIGPKKAGLLKLEAGIDTIEDLLYYPPRRYVDRSSFKPIKDCFVNEVVTVAGIIKSVNMAGRNKKFLEVVIDDGSDTLSGIFFGAISFFQKNFIIGDYILFSGKIEFYRKKQIVHPDYDFIDEDSQIKSINTGRVIPLYRSTEKLRSQHLDSRGFRRIIRYCIDNFIDAVQDPLDSDLRKRHGLMPLKEAIFTLHFPESLQAAEQARQRLSFNEIFFLQYYLGISKKHMQEQSKGDKKNPDMSLCREFISRLPFELTAGQKRSIEEIAADLERPYPMNRLLQGDVGSGKTVVAMAASLIAIGRGDQVALMSPTEILSIQHSESFKRLLPSGVKISLLTGSTPPAEKKAIYESALNGSTQILIGTHALIQNDVSFKNLGLIIIDEQHRFGVDQRAKLREKGDLPDLLIMTATPIPRSLSFTLYGDLDASFIREKPSNRIPIKTLALTESRISGLYNSMEKYLGEGRQVYFVLPLIEESEKIDLKSAVEVFNHLKKDIFPHRSVEILHGRLKAADKETIMQKFKNGEIEILVSTSVIEVGIDVPNANIIVIEHPERFGLSQLHQLRGRVGRGEYQSFCVLLHPDDISQESRQRIDIMLSTDDGFRIAEEDLNIRGSGELIGVRQHGHSGFEFADLARDLNLILAAREEALQIVSEINNINEIFQDIKGRARYSNILKGIRTKRVLSILS